MEEREREESGSSAETPETAGDLTPLSSDESRAETAVEKDGDDEEIIDVSGQKCEFMPLDVSLPAENPVSSLYIYNNSLNLIPAPVERLAGLKTLKFFANEVNVFPTEMGGFAELERLQVKVCSPGFGGVELQKLKGLKELEICRAPRRPSAASLLCGLANLSCLTRLSVCHFSIRYIPPEIGSLRKLEFLDLSFNKLKKLPDDISALTSLKSLRVACNKLVELPTGLSCLIKLESMDLSNNRLTSLDPLRLSSMVSLQLLNLQYNKMYNHPQIPSWMSCNMEGNVRESAQGKPVSSISEVDAADTLHNVKESYPGIGCQRMSSSIASETAPNSKCISQRRKKECKQGTCQQEKARQERLNNSRKLKSVNHDDMMNVRLTSEIKPCTVIESDSCQIQRMDGEEDLSSSEPGASSNEQNSQGLSCAISDIISATSSQDPSGGQVDVQIQSDGSFDEFSGVDSSAISDSKKSENENNSSHKDHTVYPVNHLKQASEEDGGNKAISKSKRHSDGILDNPKPSKCLRPVDNCIGLSCKYSSESFCGANDHLPDGFYDAGRGQPFMPMESYDEEFCLDSREIILVDRHRDEELHAIALSAQVLLSRLKQAKRSGEKRMYEVDNFIRASMLALFVSDCFGGSDRSPNIVRMRKAVAVSNYQQPFVCTCPTGSNHENKSSCNPSMKDSVSLNDLCDQSLRLIKEQRNSNIIPIGMLQFGVCRHRAVLMKYLCDRAAPPIPCELVRGYLDFMPHAWNVILVNDGPTRRRMIVDACYPADIREESDPEYFCRYMPLNRFHSSVAGQQDCLTIIERSFPSLSESDVVTEKASGSIVSKCMFGTTLAAAKVRTLETSDTSVEERKNFEHACLSEIRMLQAVKAHPCIVEIYGHQISAKWDVQADVVKQRHVLQSTIVMEYVKGGSLKAYIEKLAREGKRHVPTRLALLIARDVACALAELHSKHIIHRDIKSLNILIDLDEKRVDGSPLVKLCDFDRAVPLQSFLHTCCLAHLGVPPPDTCVGTPCWMAPEMIQTIQTREPYGLEVDVWSYGCLIYEMLMLEVPYAGLSDSEIQTSLQIKQRPLLRAELEELREPSKGSVSDTSPVVNEYGEDAETMKLLVELFRLCTEGDPSRRPTSKEAYDMLCAASSPVALPQSS